MQHTLFINLYGFNTLILVQLLLLLPNNKLILHAVLPARVAELVDALDSKSSDSNIVPVRHRPRVLKTLSTIEGVFLYFCAL